MVKDFLLWCLTSTFIREIKILTDWQKDEQLRHISNSITVLKVEKEINIDLPYLS